MEVDAPLVPAKFSGILKRRVTDRTSGRAFFLVDKRDVRVEIVLRCKRLVAELTYVLLGTSMHGTYVSLEVVIAAELALADITRRFLPRNCQHATMHSRLMPFKIIPPAKLRLADIARLLLL